MKILVVGNGTASKYYRTVPQLKHMIELGHEARMIPHNDPNFDAAIHWCDLVIFQMVFSAETVADVKKLGKKVIFECDDIIHTVPESHYGYAEVDTLWKRLKWWWRIYRVMRQCDGFISTNYMLDRMYGRFAKKSLIFPNYSDLSHWLKEPKKNLQSDTIRILWAGSTSHVGDLNWSRPILRTIMNKYPQVKFIYIGMGGAASDDLYAQFIYGEDFFQGFPKERRESMLPVHGEVWPYILSSLQADIAIAPLEKNEFNAGKSQCKYLEYAINGIPGVYSKWHYTDVKDGITGYTADSHQEWIEKLSLLIENAIIRNTISENARKDIIENHDIRKYVGIWSDFVEAIGRG